MTYLVDTDVIADWLNGQNQAIQLLSSLRQAGLSISLVTYGEIYEGIYFARDPRGAEAGFRGLLRSVPVLPLNRGILRRFARLRGARAGCLHAVHPSPPPCSCVGGDRPAPNR